MASVGTVDADGIEVRVSSPDRVIFEATNSTQLKAIADFVEEDVKKKTDEFPYKHEGKQAQQWILIDYVNIVVHVMMPEQRKFYQLEELWSDAVVMEHTDK